MQNPYKCQAVKYKQAVHVATQYASAPCKLTISSHLFARWHLFRHVGYLRHQQQVDLLTMKVVSESRVRWATSVPILVFKGLSVLELRPMYVTDKQKRQTKASLNASALWGRRHNNIINSTRNRENKTVKTIHRTFNLSSSCNNKKRLI